MRIPAQSKPIKNLSRNVRKRTYEHVRSAKIQIRLRIRAVWSEFSLGACWIAKDVMFLHVDNKMRRLIRVFFFRTCQKVRFLTLRLICCFVFFVSYKSHNSHKACAYGLFKIYDALADLDLRFLHMLWCPVSL